VFDQIHTEALVAFDKIIGLDLTEVSIDGSFHKAPYGGEGTGKNPTDRAKLGWKWSVGLDLHGVPIGWAIDGANRNDVRLLEPTLDAIAAHGLLADVDTMHLDGGYDYAKIRRQLNAAGLDDLVIQRRRRPGEEDKPMPMRLGLRWIVEATNSWLSNYGQLRRNTDRRTHHRHAALCLATTILIVVKLFAWRDRYSTDRPPIRSSPKVHSLWKSQRFPRSEANCDLRPRTDLIALFQTFALLFSAAGLSGTGVHESAGSRSGLSRTRRC